MTNWIKEFRDSTNATKGFILTLVIMGIVILASIFWGYALLPTRRSQTPKHEAGAAQSDSPYQESTRR